MIITAIIILTRNPIMRISLDEKIAGRSLLRILGIFPLLKIARYCLESIQI